MIEKIKKYISDSHFNKNIIKPWKDKDFLKLLLKCNARISPERNFILKQFVNNCLKKEGDFAEFGVYKGASALLIATLLKNKQKKLYLYDTFNGSPKQSNKDKKRKIFYDDIDFDLVKKKFEKYNFVELHKGLLPNSFKLSYEKKLIFIHLHLNLYESTFQTLDKIKNNLIKNSSIILIEDYGIKQCHGVKSAVDEFVKEHNLDFVYLPTCQGIIYV